MLLVRLIQEALCFSNLLLSINLHLLYSLYPQKPQEKPLVTLQMVTHIIILLLYNSSEVQIKYIQIIKRYYPGAVINSDHDPVLCNMRLKLRSQNMKKSNRILFNLEKLNNTHTINEYKDELEANLANINIDELSTDNAYIQI